MTDAALAPSRAQRPIARDATRLPLTMDEVLALQEIGALDGKRTQLLDGEIHELPSDGLPHIRYAMEITRSLVLGLPRDRFFVGVQTTLHLSPHNGPSPDVYVLSPGPLVKQTPAERILLVVEVADSSLEADLTDGAARYARHGVAEFWVIDVKGRQTHVHRHPQAGAYPAPLRVPFETPLSPALIAGFDIRLAGFDAPSGADEA